MKTQPRNLMTATAFLLVAALVMSQAAQLGAAVVCVGADGHIDVEFILDSCCVAATTPGDEGAGDCMPAVESCGECVDIELRVLSLKSRETQLYPPDILAEGRTFTSDNDGEGRHGLVVFSEESDQHWKSLIPLSTVVLLT